MHPLRHPRNAALVGIIFIVIAIVYFVVPDRPGSEHLGLRARVRHLMLLFLGVAMAIMAYVLVAGSSDE